MDDDVDFFTRRPASRSKSKPKAKPLTRVSSSSSGRAEPEIITASQFTSSANAPLSSHSAATAQSLGSSDDEGAAMTAIYEAEDEEDDTVLSSSDVYHDSDDNGNSATRLRKRRKQRHAQKTLSGFAMQGIARFSSQEPSSSSSAATVFDHRSENHLTGATSSNGASQKAASPTRANSGTNGREREDSLTPPPQVSPEKKALALDLVDRTIGSRYGISASATTSSFTAATASSSMNTAPLSSRVTRSNRSSATPAFGQDFVPTLSAAALRDDHRHDSDADAEVTFHPDLARLLPGEKYKRIREQARQEERRKQQELERVRQYAASQLAASSSQRTATFARVQSAPQVRTTRMAVSKDGNDTDDSVELVGRSTKKASTSPRQRRSSGGTRPSGAIIVIDDSDDEQAPTATVSKSSRASSSPSRSLPAMEAPGETLSLTVQSRAGTLIVNVTPTTLLSRLVQHFHEQKKLSSSIKVDTIRVAFDGDSFKQNQTVGDMGVEDEDQIELAWS